MASKRTWKHKFNFTSVPVLCSAAATNFVDTERYVQFAHNNVEYLKRAQLVFRDSNIMATIIRAIANGSSLSRALYDIQYNFKAVTEMFDALAKVSSLNTLDGMQNRHYKKALNNLEPLRTRYEKDSKIIDALNYITQKKPIYVIPKNSDKASLDRRDFICKPFFQEALLTSIVLTNFADEKFFFKGNNVSYRLFGGRVTSQDLLHTKNSTEFSSYITEYNMYKLTAKSLSDRPFFKVFDISKFFANIDCDFLSRILANKVATNNSRNPGYNEIAFTRIIRELLSFEYLERADEDKAYTARSFKGGLTIESHTQHVMANIFLYRIIDTLLGSLDLQFKGRVDVISYVDDFIIFGDNAHEVDAMYVLIADALAGVGLSIAKEKTSDVLSTKDDFKTLKELVRLPSRAYFDAPDFASEEYHLQKSNGQVDDPAKIVDTMRLVLARKENFGESIIESYAKYIVMDDDGNVTNIINWLFDLVSAESIDYTTFMKVTETVREIVSNRVIKSTFEEELPINKVVVTLTLFVMSKYLKCRMKDYRDTINAAEQYLGIDSKKVSDLAYYTKVWRGSNDLIGGILANSRFQSMLLKATDFLWLVQYYDTVRSFDYTKAALMVDSLSDDNILDVLQYFFITLSSSLYSEDDKVFELLTKLSVKVISEYPSKIRFLAAIIKVAFKYRPKSAFDIYTRNTSGARFEKLVTTVMEKVLILHPELNDEKDLFSPLSTTEILPEHARYAVLNGTRFESPVAHSLGYFVYRVFKK